MARPTATKGEQAHRGEDESEQREEDRNEVEARDGREVVSWVLYPAAIGIGDLLKYAIRADQ